MEPKDLFENASEKPKESPLKSLETDLILYSETLKEIALEILAEKLSDILQGSQSYDKITKQAFMRLEREFSFSSLSKRFEEIIAKISK